MHINSLIRGGIMAKGQYNTKQREELLGYLSSVAGEHVTVNDVVKHFEASGKKIGTTTVYRHLEKMVEEGIVKKYLLEPGVPACFSYIDVEKECHHSNCFHLMCTECGTLIHMHCDELEETERHIFEHHKFKIDSRRTVLYGICENCQKNQNV